MATKEGFAVVARQAVDEGIPVATLSSAPKVEGWQEEKPADEEKKNRSSLD